MTITSQWSVGLLGWLCACAIFASLIPAGAWSAEFESSSLLQISEEQTEYWCLRNPRRNQLIRLIDAGPATTQGRRLRPPRVIARLRLRLTRLGAQVSNTNRRARNVRLRDRRRALRQQIQTIRHNAGKCRRGEITSTTARDWYYKQLEPPPEGNPEDPSSPNDPEPTDPLLALIPAKERVTYALTWSGTREEHTRAQLVRMVWVRANNWNNVASIVSQLNSKPEGAKALFFWHDSHYPDMTDFAADHIFYQDQDGASRVLRGVYTETGVNSTASKFRDFFQALSTNNTAVEKIVLDTEQTRSNWVVGADRDDDDHRRRWEAIEEDPRFYVEGGVLERLMEIGFNPNRAQGRSHLLHSVWDWRNGGHNYIVWNTWRKEYESAAFTDAICNPAAAHYPSIQCSNYGFYASSPEYPVPSNNGHRDYLFGADHSVGTHQASQFYGRFGNISSVYSNSPHFQKTPFNALRYEANRARAMLLSSSRAIDPWSACRNWQESNALFAETDYWQELQFKLLMNGAESILFWNPHAYLPEHHPDVFCSAEAEDYMYRVLKEFDEIVRVRDVVPLTTELSPWNLPFIVTSIQVNAEKGTYRITRLSTEEALQGPGSQAEIAQSANGLEVLLAEYRINFPGGKILETEDPTSAHGIWIIQPPEQSYEVESVSNGPSASN